MDYPEYVKVNNREYKINTDFRIAIKCDKIARDETINDYERGLAVICVLYEEKAIEDAVNDVEVHKKLLELAQKYLACGEEVVEKGKDEDMDMDFEQDMPYIEASFQSDFGISLEDNKMHWWKFSNLLNGLSNSELGNCCVLNRVRNLRNFDIKKIKDAKERQKMIKAKEMVALKKKSKKKYTQEEQNNINDFLKQIRKE